MNINQKIKILIGILVLFVLVIIGISLLIWKNPPISLTGQFVVPKSVSLFLGTTVEGNERVPVLMLSAIASGSGCDSASKLQTKELYSPEKLYVDIIGYKFQKGRGEMCPAVVVESRAKIKVDINWLKETNKKEVVFRLANKENRYQTTYNQHQFVLNGIEASNVISHEPGYNPPISPVPLKITLYPTDVAVLYLAGSVSPDKDYRIALSGFAQTKGLIPVEKVYDGFQQTEKNQLYVVVRDYPLPEPNRSESLGQLPKEIGVEVYLGRIFDVADEY